MGVVSTVLWNKNSISDIYSSKHLRDRLVHIKSIYKYSKHLRDRLVRIESIYKLFTTKL